MEKLWEKEWGKLSHFTCYTKTITMSINVIIAERYVNISSDEAKLM